MSKKPIKIILPKNTLRSSFPIQNKNSLPLILRKITPISININHPISNLDKNANLSGSFNQNQPSNSGDKIMEKEIIEKTDDSESFSNTSAGELVKIILEGLSEIPIPILADYFGENNINSKNIDIIRGIYTDLIKTRGISASFLHKCFLTGRLDELIFKKYKNRSLEFYQDYVSNNIKIGITFRLLMKMDNKENLISLNTGHILSIDNEMFDDTDVSYIDIDGNLVCATIYNGSLTNRDIVIDKFDITSDD